VEIVASEAVAFQPRWSPAAARLNCMQFMAGWRVEQYFERRAIEQIDSDSPERLRRQAAAIHAVRASGAMRPADLVGGCGAHHSTVFFGEVRPRHRRSSGGRVLARSPGTTICVVGPDTAALASTMPTRHHPERRPWRPACRSLGARSWDTGGGGRPGCDSRAPSSSSRRLRKRHRARRGGGGGGGGGGGVAEGIYAIGPGQSRRSNCRQRHWPQARERRRRPMLRRSPAAVIIVD